MNAFTYRMPAGIPGTVNRAEHATIEAQFADVTTPPTVYGGPLKLSGAGKMTPFGAGDAIAALYGLLVRAYPGHASVDGLGVQTVAAPTATGVNGICSVMVRGYLMVALSSGSTAAVKGGPVYIRVATAATGKPIGGYEAAADGANTVVMPKAYFMGPADASGNTEIAFNI